MPITAPRRRTEDRERALKTIIRAATHLFAQRGLEEVTYGHIAKNSRMSRPLVYFYFPNREDLIQETFLRACQLLQESLRKAVEPSHNGADALERIGRAYIQFHDDHPDEARLMLLEGAHCPADIQEGTVSARLMEQKTSTIALVTEQVERGRADGSVRRDRVSATVVALNLWAFSHGLCVLRGQVGHAFESVHGVAMHEFLENGFQLIGNAIVPD